MKEGKKGGRREGGINERRIRNRGRRRITEEVCFQGAG